jgi:glycosyltransferase involved in cell wall biosynthesis
LDRDRFSVNLCCPDGFLADEAGRLGIPVRYTGFTFSGLINLAKIIRRRRFDIVNTVLLGAAIISSLAMFLSWTFPVFAVTVNNVIRYPGMSRKRRIAATLAYRFVNCLNPIYFAKSKALIEETLDLVNVGSGAIRRISNPVIFEDLPPMGDRSRIREELGIGESENAIGVIGALVPQKGHRYLIEASEIIRAKYPNTRFYFVGDGPKREELEQLAARFGSEHFTFLGDQPDSLRCILAMDLVVQPSIFEGLPNALLESLALARPVVATAVGGCKEIIEDGENGRLVEPCDVRSLAHNVIWMLDHPTTAFLMGRRGKETVLRRFAVDQVVKSFGDILKDASSQTHEAGTSEKAKTVLILISSSDIGGAQVHVEWLTQAHQLGHARIVVGCPRGPLLRKLLEQGSEVHCVNFNIFSWVRIAGIIRTVRPQVIHMHLLGAALYGAIASLITGGAKLVYTVHNLIVYPGMDRWKRVVYPFITRLLKLRIDNFIAVSNEIREFLINSTGVSQDRASLVHNGICFTTLKRNNIAPNEIRRRLGIFGDCPVMGSVGRITFQKGFDLLVKSFSVLAKEFPTLQCLIVGDGECRNQIESLIRELRLEGRVHIPGFQQGVLPWYRSMDVVVFPSRFEGLPITVIEAAFAGRPIVAADVGGVHEILEHEVSGLLVPHDDLEALTTQVRRLLNDREFAGELGNKARSVAADRFNVMRCVERTVGMYGQSSIGTIRAECS